MKSDKKIRVGVIFGGRSGEHEVSIVSAESVINSLDKNKYEIIPIGITKTGKWIAGSTAFEALKSGTKNILPKYEKLITPDSSKKGLVPVSSNSTGKNGVLGLDVIIPIIHGPFGEDGTLQGLLELADIPYAGAGVLASSVAMDKVISKQLFKQAGLPVLPSVSFLRSDWKSNNRAIIKTIYKSLKFPIFVKPANLGSSVGIGMANDEKSLISSILEASRYDRKLLIEQGLKKPREIEISILGNNDPKASVPGEIIPCNDFYDYDAKYIDEKSKAIIPAKLSKTITKQITAMAIKAYKTVDCSGMARVDFLIDHKTNKIYLNEINTIPGFTSISMYPKLWEASGLSYKNLINRLIDLAFERFNDSRKSLTSYKPKINWYKQSKK
ncbi:MAG: D-alanine--D-alanine ligase family protein [Patescibacteria group bacterium]